MAAITERKSKNGKSTFRVKVRLKGYPPVYASFDRKTDAKKWAMQIELTIKEGKYFKQQKENKHTVGELIDRYIDHVLPLKPRSFEKQKMQLKWWKKHLNKYYLKDLSSALITEHRNHLITGMTYRHKKRSCATVNRYMAVLSHALTIAHKEWGWVSENPCSKISKLKESSGRMRYLSDEERKNLLKSAKESNNPSLYIVIVLALSTGMRYSEILGMKWDQVNFDQSFITLYETKNGEMRNIPLAGLALELLKKAYLLRTKNNWVFPNKRGDAPMNFRSAWESALKRANIKNFCFHDLRHSCASYLAMNGARSSEIAAILGHKTLQMVKRYAHISQSHASKVVADMNNRIFNS